MFRIRWLRKLVRKYSLPIPERRASSMKNKLSVAYALIAWNAFGLVCYMLYSGRADWARAYGYKSDEDMAIPPAQQWARTLNMDKVKVVRMSGMHVDDYYDYNAEKSNTTTVEDSDQQSTQQTND
ncbi:hypothetical protein L9F63_002529 [Diploptera punctata]|uniref:Uncharacterized protein n=1 Tax=Diploptera punctata TaxID=6984 RepID=A0AAD7ZRX0_DIPPU|nr:hypothetical protein L9F63_002529 [Diploptera punctata]